MNKFFTVLGVIGLSFGLIYSAFMVGAQIGYERSYDVYNIKAGSDASHVGAMLALYQLDHGHYPDKLETLVGDYTSEIPQEPWGNEFGYLRDDTSAIIFTNGGSERDPRQIFHVVQKKCNGRSCADMNKATVINQYYPSIYNV
jgi:hypothetical protein